MHCQSLGAQASRGIFVVVKQESTMFCAAQVELELAAVVVVVWAETRPAAATARATEKRILAEEDLGGYYEYL
jgi:hypothetical protein